MDQLVQPRTTAHLAADAVTTRLRADPQGATARSMTGVRHGGGCSTDMEDDQWERALKANLSGAFYLLRAAARVMVEQGGGSIILVGSIAGSSGLSGQGAY